jgi:hypothetical protein
MRDPKNPASAPEVFPRLSIATRVAILLFFFCVLGWTSAGAQVVGGPIRRGEAYCAGPRIELKGSWGKLFNRIPEKSAVAEKLSLQELRVYFWQPDSTFRMLRVTPDGPEHLFPSEEGGDKPFFEWRCPAVVRRGVTT